jgi:hypothetical protein
MAIRKGLSHSQVCFAYAAWTGIAGILTLSIAGQPWPIQAGAALATAALATTIYLGLRVRWLARPNLLRVRP